MATNTTGEKGEAPAGINNAEALATNDELVDMLMLLDYEAKFCTSELKPLSRTFFVYPSNTGLQFRYFTMLVAWGLQIAPGNVKADWDEYDDPNTVIQNMMVILKDMGVPVNSVPAKLKLAHGEGVCQLLHALFKEVLRNTHNWGAPLFPDEGLADEAEVDSDAEINSVGEDEMPQDGEEDDLMYQEDGLKKPEENSDDGDHGMMENNIDPTVWKLEVERVVPKLKVTMPNDSKEWRTHLSQTKSYKQVIENQFPAAKAQLEKLSQELGKALTKIRDKENFINTQFDQRALDYRHQQEELTTVQTNYTQLSEVVMALQQDLKNLNEELEVVKNEMEDRSSTVTDTAPIVKMKDAFKKLRVDTRQLEVRIGVVSHTLMQAKLRQRPADIGKKQSLYNAGGSNSDGEYDDNE